MGKINHVAARKRTSEDRGNVRGNILSLVRGMARDRLFKAPNQMGSFCQNHPVIH